MSMPQLNTFDEEVAGAREFIVSSLLAAARDLGKPPPGRLEALSYLSDWLECARDFDRQRGTTSILGLARALAEVRSVMQFLHHSCGIDLSDHIAKINAGFDRIGEAIKSQIMERYFAAVRDGNDKRRNECLVAIGVTNMDGIWPDAYEQWDEALEARRQCQSKN
jgi:hypothetical protein